MEDHGVWAWARNVLASCYSGGVMGVISEIAAEKHAELTRLHLEYLGRFQDLLNYQDAHSPVWRKPAEDKEIERLDAVCSLAKMAYERAKRDRYTI